MPSFRSRISQAAKALFAREKRNVPLPNEGTYHWGMHPLFRPGDSLNAYGDNPWLAAAVDKLARELARTKFHLQTVNAKGEITIIQKHQALETLNRPQSIKGGKSLLTSMDLKLVTGYHLCLDGEAFWLLDKRLKVGGAPTLIDILLPEYMYPSIENGELIEYVYRLPNKEIHFDPMDVVHFKLPDPKKWQRGQPPTQAIRYALDTHFESDIFNLKKLQNGAVPGGVLETEQMVPERERKAISAEWNQGYGGALNAGKTPVLPNGLHFQKAQESNADMQYMEGKQTNKTEILARYGVGPEILGFTESQTRANAEAAIFVFQKFGASFFVEKFADTLNNEYLPSFSGTDGMTFGYPDPVPENMEEKRANAALLFDNAGMTPDEMRQSFGMQALKIKGVTDVPYMSYAKLPAGTASVLYQEEEEEQPPDPLMKTKTKAESED